MSTKAGRNDRHHVLPSLELAAHSEAEVGLMSCKGTKRLAIAACCCLCRCSCTRFTVKLPPAYCLCRHSGGAGSGQPYTEPSQFTRKGLAPLRNNHRSAMALFELRLHSPPHTKARRAAFP